PQQWDCIAVPPECAHRFESEQSVLVIDGYREESKLVEAKAAIDGRIVSAEVVREPDSEDWRLAPGHSVDHHAADVVALVFAGIGLASVPARERSHLFGIDIYPAGIDAGVGSGIDPQLEVGLISHGSPHKDRPLRGVAERQDQARTRK